MLRLCACACRVAWVQDAATAVALKELAGMLLKFKGALMVIEVVFYVCWAVLLGTQNAPDRSGLGELQRDNCSWA